MAFNSGVIYFPNYFMVLSVNLFLKLLLFLNLLKFLLYFDILRLSIWAINYNF